MNKSEQPEVTQPVCGRAWPKRTRVLTVPSVPLRAPLSCPAGKWGSPNSRVTHTEPQEGVRARGIHIPKHTCPLWYLSSPGGFPPQHLREAGLPCQSHPRAGEFHVLRRGSQGEGSCLLHHQTWEAAGHPLTPRWGLFSQHHCSQLPVQTRSELVPPSWALLPQFDHIKEYLLGWGPLLISLGGGCRALYSMSPSLLPLPPPHPQPTGRILL